MSTVLYQHDELFGGFTIRFEALPELESIQDILQYMEDEDRETLILDIRCGRTVLFMARVSAWRAGVELTETFLGGCIYETYADFIADGGYYGDMRGEVIEEAKIKIQLLQVPDKKRVGVRS